MGETLEIKGIELDSTGNIVATDSNGGTITIDTSGIINNNITNPYYYSGSSYTTTAGYYGYDDVSVNEKDIKEEIKKIIEDEDEMMPFVKNYLRKYLEKVMEAPEELVKEMMRKDKEIDEQKKEISELKNAISELRREIDRIKGNGIVEGHDITTWPNGNGITWTYGGAINTAASTVSSSIGTWIG